MTAVNDIFISHSDAERHVAVKIQQFLEQTWGDDCKVFVSSDKKSMEPGDWFDHIITNLKRSKAVLCLLSQQSFNREWINYETGVAEGMATGINDKALAKNILPIVIRGFPKDKVSWPLAHYHISDIHDAGEIEWLLDQIAKIIGKRKREDFINIDEFIREIREVEQVLPFKGIQLKPFIEKKNPNIIRFELINLGNQDYELLEVWAAVPSRLVPSHNPDKVPPAFLKYEEQIDGELHLVKKLVVTSDSLRPYYYRADFEKLSSTFTKNMSPMNLKEIHFPLRRQEENEKAARIKFQIFAKGLSQEEGKVFKVPIRDIEIRGSNL